MRNEHDTFLSEINQNNTVKVDDQDNKFLALKLELDESEEARTFLKEDIDGLNQKIIVFEEELFESKTIQLDLLDQLK